MKKLLIVVVILSLSAVACNAFKNGYDGETPAVGTQGSVAAKPGATDYASDTTVCTAIKEVTVTQATDTGAIKLSELSTAKEGDKITSTAEKVAAFTTKITMLDNDVEALSFTIKQTGDKAFELCSLKYGAMQIKSGTITIDSFNLPNVTQDATKVINAGAIKLEFTAATATATKALEAISAIAGSSGAAAATANSASTMVEGTYYSYSIKDATAAAAPATK